MQIITFRPHFSRNTLFRMLVLSLLIGAVAFWKLDLINKVYFKDQLTATGWIINGSIVVLFALGLLRMIGIFIRYSREEAAVKRFIRNQELEQDDPLQGVAANSIISRRFLAMEHLFNAGAPINQSALAATLLANESTRSSFPKYISNILILTGVFGTIVSLSLALLGASDLLENAVDVGGMGLVIHGMSTALSTTITAIICYLFFGYFYLKLTDAQTNLLSAVEQITSTYLAPRFVSDHDSTLYEFTGLVRSLRGLVQQLDTSQKLLLQTEAQLLENVEAYQEDIKATRMHLDTITNLIRRGFRLRDET